MGHFPDYAELLTCLEMARDSRKSQGDSENAAGRKP
jgi:hypothetical protein